MAIGSRREDSTWVIQTEGRLDSGNAQALCDLLNAATESPGQSVVIDMEDLVYISSAGLRAILQAVRKTERQNSRLALCSLSEDVRDVFETSGFDQLIDIHPSCPEAMAAVGR